MKRKMFMSIVMSIVLVLGLLGQAVAADGIPSKGPKDSIIDPTVSGGVQGMCTYSSAFALLKFTFTCAADINYDQNGFTATGSRSIIRYAIHDKSTIESLRNSIDWLELEYYEYRQSLSYLWYSTNNWSLSWDDIKNYAKRTDGIGIAAVQVISNWGEVDDIFKIINLQIDLEILEDELENIQI